MNIFVGLNKNDTVGIHFRKLIQSEEELRIYKKHHYMIAAALTAIEVLRSYASFINYPKL